MVWSGPEADSFPLGRCAPERARCAVGNRAALPLLEESVGAETRRSSLLTDIVDYVNTADQAVLEAQGLLPRGKNKFFRRKRLRVLDNP